MIIIWGSRHRIKEEVSKIYFECVICKHTIMRILSIRRWFTFFFVPIFPTSRKQIYLECYNCENSYKIKDEIRLDELLHHNSSKQEEMSEKESNCIDTGISDDQAKHENKIHI